MAANTGVIFGGDIMLFINTGTTEVPVWTPGAHATEHSISHSMSPREISSKDTGLFSNIRPGKHGVSTIQISALRTYDGFNYFDLLALKNGGTAIAFKLAGRASGVAIENVEAGGDEFESGTGYITALDNTNPHDGNSTMTCTISIDGETEIESVPVT